MRNYLFIALCSGFFYSAISTAQPSSVELNQTRNLSSVALQTVKMQNQKDQSLNFGDFVKTLDSTSLAQLRAAIRPSISDEEFELVSNNLKKKYQSLPVSLTIKTQVARSNDIVSFDCVAIDRQPALNNMQSDTQKILSESPPTPPLSNDKNFDATKSKNNEIGPLSNRKDLSSQPKCPVGMVAIRRHTIAEIFANPGSKKIIGMENYSSPRIDVEALDTIIGKKSLAPQVNLPYRHRYAHALSYVKNIGVSARLNVWSPKVSPDDMSLSQIWVVGRNLVNNQIQTVEAGWQVMKLWNTPFSALFIYATPDSYATGCYVTQCDVNNPVHFIIKTNLAVIGAPIPTQSQAGGQMSIIEVMWFRNEKTGSWWLKIDDEWVGFYPQAFFNGGPLAINSDYIDFGGETSGYSPTAEMGSGQYASTGRGQAAFQSRLTYFDLTGQTQKASVTPYTTDDHCYTIDVNPQIEPEPDAGTYIFYGGPGKDGDPTHQCS